MQTALPGFKDARQEQNYTFNTPLPENFPFTWYKLMRAEAPVYYDATLDVWSLFLHEDIQKVTSDYTTFSSRFPEEEITPENLDATSLIRNDPPIHKQLRGLVSQVFTPRRIATLDTMVEDLMNTILQPLLERREMDIMTDIAYPLPVQVISSMLGVPEEDQRHLKPLFDEVFALRGDTIRTDPTLPPTKKIYEYFRHFTRARRNAPRQDLISDLASAEIDGKRLSEEDLIGFCRILYSAGFVTTTNLIGNTMMCLHMYPDAMQAIREDMSALPSLIEEVLRYAGPVQAISRLVAKDVEFRGHLFKAGTTVLSYIGSAAYDERAIPNPETFDIHRTPNKHMTFGHGIHFCLGAPLARLEGPIALRAILTNMQDIKLVPGTTLEPSFMRGLYGIKNFPITFTPTPH